MRAKRTDANQREIANALRKLGWLVIDLSGVGRGVPDLLAHRPATGRTVLIEVKTAKGKLTPLQEALIASGLPVRVVRTVDEALTI